MDIPKSWKRDSIVLAGGYIAGMLVTELLVLLQTRIPISPGTPAPPLTPGYIAEAVVLDIFTFGPVSVLMLAGIGGAAAVLRARIHYPWVFAGLATGILSHIVTVTLWVGGGAGMMQIEQLSAVMGTGLYPPLFIGIAAELIYRRMK